MQSRAFSYVLRFQLCLHAFSRDQRECDNDVTVRTVEFKLSTPEPPSVDAHVYVYRISKKKTKEEKEKKKQKTKIVSMFNAGKIGINARADELESFARDFETGSCLS